LSAPLDPPEKNESLGEDDRGKYRQEVVSLAEKLAQGGSDTERTVWEVYAAAEKLIAVLKFRLDYETPGVLAKLPDAGRPDVLVGGAAELLSQAAAELEQGKVVPAIETLRMARNNLRSYLREKTRAADAAERKKPPKRGG
jgi:hypothetical protein